MRQGEDPRMSHVSPPSSAYRCPTKRKTPKTQDCALNNGRSVFPKTGHDPLAIDPVPHLVVGQLPRRFEEANGVAWPGEFHPGNPWLILLARKDGINSP